MPAKKMTWKSMMIILTCCKTEISFQESQEKGGKQCSFRRLSLSDVWDDSRGIADISNSFVGAKLHVFTLEEMQQVTCRFTWSNLLGEGGFGAVYKGFMDEKLRPCLEPQPVAIKVMDLNSFQGHREWMAEIIFLGQLRHPNLVKLIGYCCEEEHRLLCYEYLPRGSLENQLFNKFSAALPWSSRMKIALGAARGLAFLHGADKPVIFRDFKTSNILLESDYTAKLSDFGLAKDGPEGEETLVATRIMGTQGYAAPEYIMTGHLTTKCDVYSFGVVLLELLTGRRAIHKSRTRREQSLVEWARPQLKDTTTRLKRLVDCRLEGQYPSEGARKIAAMANRCLSYRPKWRPSMKDVVNVLELLQDFHDDVLTGPFVYYVARNEKGDRDT